MAIVLSVSPLLRTKEFRNVFFLLLTRWQGTKVELRISTFQAGHVVSSCTCNKDHWAANKYTLCDAPGATTARTLLQDVLKDAPVLLREAESL